MTRLRLHVCLLCARGTGRVSQPRACREARGQAERTVSAEPSVSSTPVRVVNSSRLSCFVAYLVAYSSAEKWSMSGLKNVGALRKLHALEPQRVGVCRATRLPLVPAPVCAAQPKLCGPSELPRELRVRCVVASEQWPCPQRTALSSFAA